MRYLFFACFIDVFGVVVTRGNYGKEFYIGMFPSNDTIEDIRIDVASKTFGEMTTEVPFLNLSSQLFLVKGATTVHVSSSLLKTSSYSENRGIHIRTTVPVAVTVTLVGLLMESYLALPVTSLGTSYKIAAYTSTSYLLVGSSYSTTVYFSDSTRGSSEKYLNKSDVLQIINDKDLSDTAVWGNKKVSLISGTSGAFVPSWESQSLCNFMVEQMVPSRLMSKYFIVPSLMPLDRYVLRSFSLNNTYHCYRNTSRHFCKSTKTVNNDKLTFGTSSTVVLSDILATVVQYGYGIKQYYDTYSFRAYAYKRPFMITVPGISNYRNDYSFAIPTVYNELKNYLCVIVPIEDEDGLRLNEANINSKSYRETAPSPFSNYTVFKVEVSVGYHELNHVNKKVLFGALVFGIADPAKYRRDADGGYGFPAGIGEGGAECSLNTCDNGGTCTETVEGESCICASGYTGILCGEEINECTSNPCQNHGICLDAVASFTCECVKGFTGNICQTEINECTSNPCQNNGVCLDAVNSFTCACVTGFAGKLCQTASETPATGAMGNCSSVSCQNNGTCQDISDGFLCSCVAGFSGLFCENTSETATIKPLKGCVPNPCQNKGTCLEVTGGFVCTCVQGFYGIICENAGLWVETEACSTDPCMNGASCTDVGSSFVCSCTQGFYGTLCEKQSTLCSLGLCLNGGLCKESGKNFTCYCSDGFAGRHCEKRAESMSSKEETSNASKTENYNTSLVMIVMAVVILVIAAVGIVVVVVVVSKKKNKDDKYSVHYHRDTDGGISNETYRTDSETRGRHEAEMQSDYSNVSIDEKFDGCRGNA